VVTIWDNDPTVVSLARTGSGGVLEGAPIAFTVTLGRALVAGEVIDVPLSIGGTNVSTADWSLATKTGADLNTGVTLSGESTATPKVRFTGAGAETATLALTPADDFTARARRPTPSPWARTAPAPTASTTPTSPPTSAAAPTRTPAPTVSRWRWPTTRR